MKSFYRPTKKSIAAKRAAAKASGFKSWGAWAKVLEKKRGRPICGAMTKRKTPCASSALMAGGRCILHGGKSPVGPEHPSWKTGERSKLFPTLPDRLQESAQRSYSDPELISTRKQLSILDARSEELLSQLSTGESGAAWKAAWAALDALRLARAVGDEGAEKACMAHLHTALKHGLGDQRLWTEWQQTIENARRLRDTEMSRLKQLQAYIDGRTVKAIMARFMAIILKVVRDPPTLRYILEEVKREFGGNGQQALPATVGEHTA